MSIRNCLSNCCFLPLCARSIRRNSESSSTLPLTWEIQGWSSSNLKQANSSLIWEIYSSFADSVTCSSKRSMTRHLQISCSIFHRNGARNSRMRRLRRRLKMVSSRMRSQFWQGHLAFMNMFWLIGAWICELGCEFLLGYQAWQRVLGSGVMTQTCAWQWLCLVLFVLGVLGIACVWLWSCLAVVVALWCVAATRHSLSSQ